MLNLGQVFDLVGEWGEASTLYQQALSLAQQLGDRQIQAQAQRALGWLLRKQGEYTTALEWLNHARAAFEQLGDEAGAIQALADLGEVYRLQGAYLEADRCYKESLDLASMAPQSKSLLAARANALKGAGTLANQQGDPARARERV